MAKRSFKVSFSSPPLSWEKNIQATNAVAAANEALRHVKKDKLEEGSPLTIIVTSGVG